MRIPLAMRRGEDQFPGTRTRMRRGMYISPSLFTAANIGAGYFAITLALQGNVAGSRHFNLAATAMGAAISADDLDARVARLTATTRQFGRHFDLPAASIPVAASPAVP